MSDPDAELRALQARAYGRDADIGDDPEAQRRLETLEERRQPWSVPASSIPAPAEPPLIDRVPLAPASGSAPTRPPPPAPDDRAAEPDGQPTIAPPFTLRDRFSPRPRMAWFAAAAAALLLTVGITATVTAIARPVEPGVVATIPVDPDAQWNDILGTQDEVSVIFEDYYGLTLVRSRGFFGPGASDAGCLLAVSTKGLNSGNSEDGFGPFSVGCPAGDFPASIQFVVDDGYPDALRERYPSGTGMRFTMRGNVIEVRADR